MTAIAAQIAVDGGPIDLDGLRAALGAMSARGGRRRELWPAGGGALAVSHQAREGADSGNGTPPVYSSASLAVVADATLYYTDDLQASLRAAGHEPDGLSTGPLIAAAYRAWGEACPARLEGDFAFVLWDAGRNRLLAARDFGGGRTLYHVRAGPYLVLASSLRGILAHPACSDRLDEAVLAETAAGLWEGPERTVFRGIRALPAGHTLCLERGGPLRLRAHWSPPEIAASSVKGGREAAAELRALLCEAVRERMDGVDRPTTVWMSGGWDSTSVFAAGRGCGPGRGRQRGRGPAAGEGRGTGELFPVSMSYPPGDPGREDALVRAVAAHWSVPVLWRDASRVSLFDRAERRAETRPEPFWHPFEAWNRALARGSRELGARVAMTGYGGDQLFRVSDVYLTDLLVRGRWIALLSDWRRRRRQGEALRSLARRTWRPLTPLLPYGGTGNGRRDQATRYLERSVPSWIRKDFVRRHGLLERQRELLPPARPGRLAEDEMRFALTLPQFANVHGRVTGYALEEGVELRSPLMDGRIVRFAAERPRSERNDAGDLKRLLRRAMEGWLPADVLAPRGRKTGLTGGFLVAQARRALPDLHARLGGAPRLTERGIVDPESLASAVSRFAGEGGEELALRLSCTLQAELWLLARESGEEPTIGVTAGVTYSTGEGPGLPCKGLSHV